MVNYWGRKEWSFLPGRHSNSDSRGGPFVTVIAANLETMAGDTRIVHDQIVVSPHRKIHVVRNMLVGYAGCVDSGILFLEWCKRGMGSRGKPGDLREQFTGLVLDESGLYEYKWYLVPIKIEGEFWAVGSGAPAALGAMRMGATPEEAAKIACEIDPDSGGRVVTETLTG